jgi:solute carrier family 25 phosphate transporter 23/24/25/41
VCNRKYLWDQERQLWDMFQELDKNGDGVLDMDEMNTALVQGGVKLSGATVKDIVRLLSGSASGESVTFPEFRDFLLMLPRRATPNEIYKFYQVHKRFSDGRGVARVDKDGDLNPSFPKAPGGPEHSTAAGFLLHYEHTESPVDNLDDAVDVEDEEVYIIDEGRHDAWRFLLAGGVAGGVSRSVTAPFDRLKIYLITSTIQPDPNSKPSPFRAIHTLWSAMGRIYHEGGGVRAFWVGNGLNIVKILPESAIKFVSYEQAKRVLARVVDGVSDPADVSSLSRFIAGGFGGISAQLSIYGLETLKTRIQSETGPAKGWRDVVRVAQSMYAKGGVRSFYRGLGLGLIGVFPYSAIDMGTYESLKNAYLRSTGKDEPEIYAVLSFGALSGSIGAASVYPINLLRTRLQASGSSGHPQQYTGFMDVARQTWRNEGPRGMYKGLLPTLLKVGPAVGVSWIVYEDMKRRLGV